MFHVWIVCGILVTLRADWYGYPVTWQTNKATVWVAWHCLVHKMQRIETIWRLLPDLRVVFATAFQAFVIPDCIITTVSTGNVACSERIGYGHNISRLTMSLIVTVVSGKSSSWTNQCCVYFVPLNLHCSSFWLYDPLRRGWPLVDHPLFRSDPMGFHELRGANLANNWASENWTTCASWFYVRLWVNQQILVTITSYYKLTSNGMIRSNAWSREKGYWCSTWSRAGHRCVHSWTSPTRKRHSQNFARKHDWSSGTSLMHPMWNTSLCVVQRTLCLAFSRWA